MSEQASSWGDRMRGILRRTKETLNTPVGELVNRGPTPETLEELEEALIRADIGVETTMELVDRLESAASRKAEVGDLVGIVRDEFLAVLRPESSAPALTPEGRVPEGEPRPWVVLLVGVNGTGKTTTAARLARRMREAEGEPAVVLAACDTFRAAAIEQLEAWAGRLECPVVRHNPGSDASAVLFDAIASAKAKGASAVLADTAGRSHTREDLMGELSKLGRIAGREVEGAPHEVLLVLDATTGQNGLQQARAFTEALPLTGLVLTKMDGTARGGIAVAAVRELGVPVRWVGLGEGMEDLVPFDPEAYVDGLLG